MAKRSNTPGGLSAYVVQVACLIAFAFLALGAFRAGKADESRIFAYGSPSKDYVVREGYALSTSGHSMRWVLEHLTADSFKGQASRDGDHFHPDPAQPECCRWTDSDYLHSGYDKGHGACADDMRFSQKAMDESFLFGNTMPQTPELNRGPLRILEANVQKIAKADGAEVWCITGPAYLPDNHGEIRIKTIGKNAVWVPTHVWKAILVRLPPERFAMQAWLLPNTDKPGTYQDCQTTVREIEQATGLDLFDGLPDELEEKLETSK